ncbi:glycosyl transferase family 90-domain-containing protein [Flammula alnicola]|nr:glycosyl transferase family 90-domain-containing protein [Flammula alnicola]
MALMQLRGVRRRLIFILLCIITTLGLFSRWNWKHESSDSNSSVLHSPEPLHGQYASKITLRADPSATHTYLPNGLLEVNPDGPHPIIALARDAEKKWQEKLSRASTTLDEAVREYKRRYKLHILSNNSRAATSFKRWNYAQENQIQAGQEEVTDTFTISRNETHETGLARVAFSTPDLMKDRVLPRGLGEILDLLQPVEHLLPPFRAIFSPHDNPNLLSDYHVKKAFSDAAKEGRSLWIRLCLSPGSPGRLTERPVNQFDRPEPRMKKTFIYDHQRSMDPCTSPTIFYHHAQYVAHDLARCSISWCSTPLFHNIQPPTFISWVDDVRPRENDPPWEEKTDERLMWRGSNTGIMHNKDTRWIYAQRIHLMRMATERNGTEKVLLPDISGFSNPYLGESVEVQDEWQVGEGVDMRKSVINPAMMDVALRSAVLRVLKTLFEWREKLGTNSKEVGNHKYFIDVDGNGWSSRFKRLITTNSLVFKATAYPEWWIDRIQPWVHYVPVQVDYSDLYDAYVFFRGGLYGEGNHDKMAQKIALAGREWSKGYWRKEDMTAYFFRLMLEYARIMSLDREAMSYQE